MLDVYVLRLPALLLAIVGHEFAHALAADRLGDPTPRRTGRLTFNPIAHLDPVGLLCLWLLGFGWAKPVQINPYFFRVNRRTGLVVTALAGPLANIVMATLALVLIKLSVLAPASALFRLVWIFLQYNLALAVFNLIPIPPLDGWRVLEIFAPSEWVEMAERYGWLLLLVFLATGAVSRILGPLMSILVNILDRLTFFVGAGGILWHGF